MNALLFSPKDCGWYLSLNKTNWQLEMLDINTLMLSLVWQGIATPLMWSFLPTKNNSNTKNRKAFLKRFIKLFGINKIASLLMDQD
jgi:hypothetical protein